MTALVSLGVAGALGPALVARIAREAEDAGLHALWVNDTPQGDAIACLGAAASVTTRLVLATGVLPLDRRPAARLVDDIAHAEVPPERLVLGVGSGAMRRGALDLVAGGIDVLRGTEASRILVGALGPRMRRLGAERGDGVLLSWLTPAVAGAQAADAHAVDAGATAALYVRTAVDAAGAERMREEADRYGSYPQYAANLGRLEIDVHDTVLSPDRLDAGLAAYRPAVDEVVLRAIVAEDTAAAYRGFIDRIVAA